jgi:hypothetical protein
VRAFRACVSCFRRRKGTEQARQHRYVDSPLVTGKPRVDRETGTIPWVQPMAQRTASFGSDPVGAPRCIGACPLRYYLVDRALESNGAHTGHPLPHLALPCCGWWLTATHPIKLSTDTRLVADCYARRTRTIGLGNGLTLAPPGLEEQRQQQQEQQQASASLSHATPDRGAAIARAQAKMAQAAESGAVGAGEVPPDV